MPNMTSVYSNLTPSLDFTSPNLRYGKYTFNY